MKGLDAFLLQLIIERWRNAQTPSPHSFQSYMIQLQVAVPGVLGNLGCTSLEPPPPMLGWIHRLTGPPREKPGAGPGKVRGNRAGYIDLGSSRRKKNKKQSPERYSNSHQPHSKGIQHDSTEERESWHIVGAHELFREERDFVAMSSKN